MAVMVALNATELHLELVKMVNLYYVYFITFFLNITIWNCIKFLDMRDSILKLHFPF